LKPAYTNDESELGHYRDLLSNISNLIRHGDDAKVKNLVTTIRDGASCESISAPTLDGLKEEGMDFARKKRDMELFTSKI
jgi:hypothetical protein